MKKCIQCGQEIPDDAVFCGFCGTRQPEAENKKAETVLTDSEKEPAKKETEASPESEKNEPAETEEKKPAQKPSDAEPAGDASSEKADTVPADKQKEPSEMKEDSAAEKESVSPEQKPEETNDSSQQSLEEEKTDAVNDAADQPVASVEEKHEIRDAEFTEKTEPVKEKQEQAENSSLEKEKTSDEEQKPEDKPSSGEEKKEKKKPHIDVKKVSLPETHFTKEDFSVLLAILKEPDQNHSLTNTAAGIILVFAWIAGWIAFGSFGNGFFSLLLVMVGLIFIDWLTRKDHVTFGQTVRDSAEVIFAPSVLVFLGGLFIRNIRAGAEVYAFHSIFTTAFIGLFFLMAALILLVITIVKKYERRAWQMTVILTVFLSLLAWFLATSGNFVLL